jgi:hypothetical protein
MDTEESSQKVVNHRAGKAGLFGVPVVDLLVCFLFMHARLRVHKTPGFPCALSLLRDTSMQDSGAIVPREAESRSAVIASQRVARMRAR